MTSECGDSFEVIVGTYEEFLLGYKFQKVGQEYKFVQSIAEHSHKSSVRAVTMHNHLLASGGADETIHLYDLVSRKETGVLMQHSGTVNCLKFTPDGAFLVSCSEDGSLAIFRVGNWVLEKVWPKAHKGEGVNSVSVHPSGKLALTVGNDSTLRTWNLVKGRRAYATNIGRKSRKPECVHWSGGEGSYYGVPYDTKLDIYSVQTAGVVHSIQLSSKVSCFTFINDVVCAGGWDGKVFAHSCNTGENLWTIDTGSETRIKSLTVFRSRLVCANSEGVISVYDLTSDPPSLLARVETGCRITCMAVGDPSMPPHVESKKSLKRLKKLAKTEATLSGEQEVGGEEDEGTKKKKRVSLVTNGNKAEVICSPGGQKWKVETVS